MSAAPHPPTREHDTVHEQDERDVLVARYKEQIAAMTRIMEAFPHKHIRFGVMGKDGEWEPPSGCADYCYACTLDQLRDTNRHLTERHARAVRMSQRYYERLKEARAEAAELKARLDKQDAELSAVIEERNALQTARTKRRSLRSFFRKSR